MALDITNKTIKAERIGDLKEVINRNPRFHAAKKYNYIRVQFPNGMEVPLLFTNNQIKRAIERANKNPEDLPEVSWIRNLLDLEIIDTDRLADLQNVKNQNKLPNACMTYNHIRIQMGDQKLSLLFTDKEIKVAKNRASKNPEDLPKVSWLQDLLD